MDEQDRPGGLTALAVINFIFAAISALGILMTFISRSLISSMPMDQMSEAQIAQLTVVQNMSGTTLAIIACVSTISFLLLLFSGIGYLKQKKVMGRVLGSSYGVLSIIYSIISTMIFSGAFGKSFGIMAIIGLIYPVLTLILLNTVYKDDLIY
jgi:hypothetical protein